MADIWRWVRHGLTGRANLLRNAHVDSDSGPRHKALTILSRGRVEYRKNRRWWFVEEIEGKGAVAGVVDMAALFDDVCLGRWGRARAPDLVAYAHLSTPSMADYDAISVCFSLVLC